MQYISSDTNVWIDFATIDRIEYPFRLPYTYLMFREAIEDEFLSPDTKQAVSLGLVATVVGIVALSIGGTVYLL